VALGAEGGGGDVVKIDPIQFIAAIVVFLLAFGILAKLAWPKILGGLDEREKKIREEIFAAEESRRQAERAQADYAKELSGARAEAQRMIEQTKAEQSRMAAELKSAAETEMAQMRDAAMANIESAKRAALNEIYSETVTISTLVAEKILEREVNEADQKRLVEDTLGELVKRRGGVATGV
jgi:F-type H+-transporting ATPase subunit b